jgi:hypothetical protein
MQSGCLVFSRNAISTLQLMSIARISDIFDN